MKFKKVEKPNQKLTNFFPRRDSNASSGPGPSSSQPSGSLSMEPLGKKAGIASPMQDPEVISVSSGSTHKSHISISSGMDSSVVVLASPPRPKSTRSFLVVSPPRRSTRVQNPPPPPAPLSSIPLKRSRPPSIQYMGMSQHPAVKPSSAPKPRTPVKRKKKFDNDSEVSPNDSVIMLRKSSGAPKSSTLLPPFSSRPSAALKSSSVINISSSPCKSPSKRPLKKARFTQRDNQDGEMVPSSQSDERELAAVSGMKNTEDVQQSINRWRQEAVSPDPSVHDDWDMDIDADIRTDADGYLPDPDLYSSDGDPLNLISDQPTPNSSPLQSSEAEVCTGLLSSGTNSSTTVPTTPATPLLATSIPPKTPPPAISNAPLPVTPVALSEESKTAQIIAQIKANALAASASSPDETSKVFVYKELDDSSSSDEEDGDGDVFDLFKHNTVDKGKGKNIAAASSHKDDDPFSSRPGSSTRSSCYSLLDHTLSSSSSPSLPGSPSTSKTRRNARSRASLTRQAQVLTKPALTTNNNKKRKKATVDPLDFLLKEKRLADKRGNGMDALRLAEESMDVKMDEDGETAADDKTGKVNELMDEAAARKAIEEGVRLPPNSSSPGDSIRDDSSLGEESVVLGEDEAKLLGLKNGGQMKKILDSDRAKKGQMKEEKVLGVKLWDDKPRPMDCPMVVRSEFPSSLADAHPVLRLLRNAWNNWSDVGGVVMLVDSGVLASFEPSKYVPLIPFLCETAFSGHDMCAGDSAFRILSYLWSGLFPEIDNFVSLISSALIRLGASPTILESLGWTSSTASNEFVNADDRAVAIYRFVCLVQSVSRTGALTSRDTPDTFMALLLIAMDPSSSADLKRDIMMAVDTICQSLKGDSDVASATELALCNKALKFSANLTPINKAHFISFLSGGCGRTVRIARWLAHGLLLGTDVSAEQYSELPPLSNLIQLLSPAPGSGSLFDIYTNADTIDYEDLGYQVEILSIALSGINGYGDEERRVEAAAPREKNILDSPGKLGKEKPFTRLDMVRTAIDVIHGKIVDTRAAHLDRSRTKAALQRLSMRIYYQRLAASKSGQRGGTRKIRDYFAPK